MINVPNHLQQLIISLYSSGDSVKTIEKIVGYGHSVINRVLRTNGILKRGAHDWKKINKNRWYEVIEKQRNTRINNTNKTLPLNNIPYTIKDMYRSGKSTREISQLTGLGKSIIPYRLRELGIEPRGNLDWQIDQQKILKMGEKISKLKKGIPQPKNRNYSLDERFFENIDSEDKAYTLGLFQTDGSISGNNYRRFRIELHKKDEDVLYLISKFMKSNALITNPKNTTSLLSVNSIILVQDLLNMGFTSNKTYNSPFINVPCHLKGHYIRGIIDGDGSVWILKKNGSIGVSFGNGSLDLVKGVWETVYQTTGRTPKITNEFLNPKNSNRKRPYKNDFYRFSLSGKSAFIFLSYLYEGSNIFIKRKYDTYVKSKEKYSLYI